jgi:bla regulator protein blaR1
MDATLNWLWQGSVVAAAASAMLLALARARANVRYTVCWAASLGVLALPAVASLPSTEISTAASASDDAILSLPDVWWTSTIVMVAAWAAWVSIQFVRFVSAIVAIRRARARSRPFPQRVESILPHWRRVRLDGRHATLVLSDSVRTAAVFGWGAPLIAVSPSLVTRLGAEELDRILIHEWAHVQRRDDLGSIVQIVVRIIAGWHPAVWWIDRRLHVEREIACDETTVSLTGCAKSYAECLVKLSSLGTAPRAMQTAPAVFASSGLRARITKIVSPRPSIAPAWSRSIAIAIVAILCVMCGGLAGLRVVQAAAVALPSGAPRMLSASVYLRGPVAAAPSASANERAARQVPERNQSAPRQTVEEPSPTPQPQNETQVRTTLDTPNPIGSTSGAAIEAAGERVVPGDVPSAPPTPDVTADQLKSPWTAAAAGGTAIGRKSKDAGAATAGFFTRFARRVAGSF